MFHQANVISTEWAEDPTDPLYVSPRPTNDASLLEYWYIRVLAEMAQYLNTAVFPVQVRNPATPPRRRDGRKLCCCYSAWALTNPSPPVTHFCPDRPCPLQQRHVREGLMREPFVVYPGRLEIELEQRPKNCFSRPFSTPSLPSWLCSHGAPQRALVRFPVEQTLKFDNLCHNFYQHEDLDNSGAVLTATKDPSGAITGMTLSTTSNNGAPIPLTVTAAAAAANSVSFGSLSPDRTETYGADTTFTFAAGTLNTGDLDKPAVSE